MQIVIDIPNQKYKWIVDNPQTYTDDLCEAIRNGKPLPEQLSKIKDDIGKYELDCRFADYSQTDECTICNKNVFGSIYKIIDKYIEGSESK